MSRYTADSRDRVFQAVDMLALIGTRSDLRRAGVNSYFGLCPFHDERTGSFHVRPDEKHYHCFGCQMSGDPFDFVMETEGLDFKAALETLADRFGVKLETEDEDPAAAAQRERRERLYALLGRAAVYYSRYLWEAREAESAREYLLGRGFTEETLREFRVGYAPSAWDRMLLASRKAGFSDEELLAVGLAQRSRDRPGSIYDRFRRRIMFPAADSRGKVRGFGARAMSEDTRGPKYLNTSDGELYHKREQLYGIDLARAPAARTGRMILVEGYTDVLAMHQAGFRNTVGIMGTSFTSEQAAELERVVSVLELCLDADTAGQNAMLGSARLTAGTKLELRVVPLPEGTDPGELIEREGADALRARVEASAPFVVFQVERILDRDDTRTAEGRDRALSELKPLLSDLPSGVLHDELFRLVTGKLGLSGSLEASLAAAGRPSAGGATNGDARGGPAGGEPRSPAPTVGDTSLRTERTFLALCVAMPAEGEQALAAIDPDQLLTSGVYRRAARHLAGRTRAPLGDLPPEDEELARTVADLVDRAGRGGVVRPAQLEHARLLLELARADRAIKRARVEPGSDVASLARERERVRAEIGAVVARLEQHAV